MAAPAGNQFWKARSKHGRDKIFASPELLWDACCEYFNWVEENPLYEAKAFSFQGSSWIEQVPKMRAMTIEGLSIFLGVNSKYFAQFESSLDLSTEEGKGFSNIITDVREVIKSQKFAGAAADLLNANIIARDLGLTDKKDLSSSDGTMSPKAATINITPEMAATEAANAYRELMEDDS